MRIDAAGAIFDDAAAELEGFARPLWGLAAAAFGAIELDCWPLYRRGLTNGTDPDHPDYWGDAGPVDQRLVDLAAIGFALCVARPQLWDPLDDAAKAHVRAYLSAARDQPFSNNNWKFFRLIIDLGLEAIGVATDHATQAAYLREIDGFWLGDGWYRDGHTDQLDHYVGFAFHFYGLLYARLSRGEAVRAEIFRARARLFAPDFQHWFASDGAALPFGRSLTYRFGSAAFWGALAFADVEALPWGIVKGLYLRHLRWWSRQPMMRRDGVLTLGYAYPNAAIAEDYSSAMSPYWAFKAFLPLALPANHPFWLAEEQDGSRPDTGVPLSAPGMLVRHEPGQTIALSSGQSNIRVRHGAEKYAKFAYSTRYGFSVEADLRAVDRLSLDSMLGLIDEDGSLRVREACEVAEVANASLYALWRPWRDVAVETWLWWDGDWQMRLHRIRSERRLRSIEGGFAMPRAPIVREHAAVLPCAGLALESDRDWSGILATAASGRQARHLVAQPNTNLLHPRTAVPQLLGDVARGETIACCAVLATPDLARARLRWASPPDLPTEAPGG